MADGYSHGSLRPVDPDAEADRLAAGRKLPDWQPTRLLRIAAALYEALARCARCGALVYSQDVELHDSWHGGQSSLPERVRTLATRDRDRGRG
jgi:hypothetical protein